MCLQLCSLTLGLEVSVGKAPVIYTRNGTDVLLPCTFTSCIGINKANFSWFRNHTELIFKGVVKNKDSRPEPYQEFRDWFKYMMPPDIALSKDNREFNVSLLLLDADFSDSGKYTCLVKNPKEKDATHNDTIILKVVVELEKVDNTLTLIIVSVVGGVIGILILIMVIKKLTLFALKKMRDKKECLVSSSANDNTENGLARSKAEQKSAPKA
ncbi:sodium channel subunit beta-4 isoform X3 [Sceloporus undulatus]|uniref:sodium channel subunit beta-4 isoform X3 n=1 Tax=Sceloporus undulatus TaxID=8520 RepID=UPI001C4B38C8|nr:sodium channel subunit beta-4 isoform X3 [Sceloporus undulatus]